MFSKGSNEKPFLPCVKQTRHGFVASRKIHWGGNYCKSIRCAWKESEITLGVWGRTPQKY